jgi:dTDP-glucose 4,6-dehydratase
MTHIPEDYLGAPDCQVPNSAYGEGKRAAEMLCALYYKQFQIPVKIARCFAFVGPYLPLDAHFAIGNFINDGLKGDPIIIKGDGTPYRSYLYASDLIIWLLKILILGGSNFPYNVGSDEDLPITELADHIRKCFATDIGVIINLALNSLAKPDRYVPLIEYAKIKLKLDVLIKLDEAINKTIQYNIKINKKK